MVSSLHEGQSGLTFDGLSEEMVNNSDIFNCMKYTSHQNSLMFWTYLVVARFNSYTNSCKLYICIDITLYDDDHERACPLVTET